mmetsp:Transcript_3846/g.24376  ORF Transcript_3846/g.24376 Transcript_3846/m.24376 type:complete len:330 (-) Transcript_3846:5216-6205(-)
MRAGDKIDRKRWLGVAWVLTLPLVASMYSCKHNQWVKEALSNSNESARGFNKAVFKVVLESKPYILKTNGYIGEKFDLDRMKKGSFQPQFRLRQELPPLPKNPQPYIREMETLRKFSSPGLPKLEGYCISKEFTWLLLEHAQDSLRALSTREPNEEDIFRMATSVVCLFRKYPQLGVGTDAGAQQYAFTLDWQIKVVDLDILVVKNKFVANVRKQLATATCSSEADCRNVMKKTISGREVQRCITVLCQNRKCIYEDRNFEKDTACALAEGVFKPLLRFGFLWKIYQTCRGNPKNRPTIDQLLHMLCCTNPQCSSNNLHSQCVETLENG